VPTLADLTRLLKSNNMKEGVRLFVWRDGSTIYTFLQADTE
jgi:hypothetical protein